MKAKQMVGLKFNRLTILSREGSNKKRSALWKCKCKCDCGNIKILVGTEIRNGIIKSCGCYMKEQISKRSRRTDLLGKKFNQLLVIERSHQNESGKTLWTCLCRCGGIIKTKGYMLKNGNTGSCGCSSRGNQTHGTIYGIYRKGTEDLVYVGQTVKYKLKDRLKNHLIKCNNEGLKLWLLQNQSEIKPLIEKVKIEDLDMMEKQLIKIITQEYHPLFNIQHNS